MVKPAQWNFVWQSQVGKIVRRCQTLSFFSQSTMLAIFNNFWKKDVVGSCFQ